MRYHLSDEKQADAAFTYLSKLSGQEAVVDIKRINPKRTIPQNAYLHLLLTAFGMHFGYTLEEAKQVYKEINAGTYAYKKKKRTFWRSSADLDKAEMQLTIDKLMRKSADAGCPLPLAENAEWLSLITNESENNKYV